MADGRFLAAAVLGALALGGCGRFADPGAKLDRIEAKQTACENAAAGDPTALIACHGATREAAGALLGQSRQNAAFERLLNDMYEPLVLARGGGDALAERVTVSAGFAELAVRRAAILTGAASAKGPENTVRTFSGWPDVAQGRGFAARWTAIRTADCKTYDVRNCARRMDAAMRRTVQALKPKKGGRSGDADG